MPTRQSPHSGQTFLLRGPWGPTLPELRHGHVKPSFEGLLCQSRCARRGSLSLSSPLALWRRRKSWLSLLTSQVTTPSPAHPRCSLGPDGAPRPCSAHGEAGTAHSRPSTRGPPATQSSVKSHSSHPIKCHMKSTGFPSSCHFKRHHRTTRSEP